MKIFVNGLVLLVAASVGLGIGFVLRRAIHPDRTMTAASPAALSEALPSQRQPPVNAVQRPQIDDSPLTTRLARDLAISAGVSRWLLWLDALERATPADFPRLAILARGNPAATRFLAQRWVEVAPRHLFDHLVAAVRAGNAASRREMASVLFEQWPKKDPESAIAALNETAARGLREWGRHTVANVVLGMDAERGLRLMSDWHIENYGPRMNTVKKWAAAGPQHAAEFTLQYASGFAAELAMETIGQEWARISPKAALEFALANEGKLGAKLANSALTQWATDNLSEAAAWLASTEPGTRNRLSPAFVEAWAKKDSLAAFEWCEQNLHGSSLANAVRGVAQGQAEKNVQHAAEWVTGMEPSPARAEAAVAVAQKWFPNLSSEKKVTPEMVAWLSGLDRNSSKSVLERLGWNWATSDPKSMAAFLEQAPGQIVPSYTDAILARQLARNDPAGAIEWANRLPESRALTAGAAAFTEWRNSQPKAAMTWLAGLGAKDSRRQPFFKSAVEAMVWHPQATEQLAALSASERGAARSAIEKMTLPDERRAQLLGALTQP